MAEEKKIELENGVELEYKGAYSEKELGNLYSPPKQQDTTDIKRQNYFTVSNTALDRAIANSGFKNYNVQVQPSLFDIFDEIDNDKINILPLIKYQNKSFSKQEESKDIILLTKETRAFSTFDANDIKIYDLSRALIAGKLGHRDEKGKYKISLKEVIKLFGLSKGGNQYDILRRSILKVGSLGVAVAGNIKSGVKNVYQEYLIEQDTGFITMEPSNWYINDYLNKDTTFTTRDIKGFTIKGDIPNRIYSYLLDRYTHKNNILKHTNKIVSVASLLKDLERLLPTKEEAKDHPQQRRGKPIIDAFDYLKDKGFLTGWEFCGAKAKPLTAKEKTQARKSYSFFESLFITYEMPLKDDKGYMNYADSVIKTAEQRAENKAKREKKKEK